MVGLVVVVAGCTAAPSTPPVPQRPREVRIDGVDPCTLLTEQQRKELGLDQRPAFGSAPAALYGGAVIPQCSTRGFTPRAITVGVAIVTTTGIERFTSGKLDARVQNLQVRDFPAVVAVPTRFTEYCSVIIDVAPHQLLEVQFADGGRLPPIPQEQLCRDAEHAADAAMATLLTLR